MGCQASTSAYSPTAVEPHGQRRNSGSSKSIAAKQVQDSVFLSQQRWMAADDCEDSVPLQSVLQSGKGADATDSISLAEMRGLRLASEEEEKEAESRWNDQGVYDGLFPSALCYLADGVPLGKVADFAGKGVHELGRATAGLAEVGHEVADTGMHLAVTATLMAEKGLQKGLQETRYAARNVGLPVPISPSEKHIENLIKANSTMVFYELEGKEPKHVKKDHSASFDEEILRRKTGVEAAMPMIFVEGRYIGSDIDLSKLMKKEVQETAAKRPNATQSANFGGKASAGARAGARAGASAEPVGILHTNEIQFNISLDMTSGRDLCMDIVPAGAVGGGGRGLLIAYIRPGLVTDWNKRAPNAKVVAGDRIIEVNGVPATAANFAEGIKKSKMLKLRLCRCSAHQYNVSTGAPRTSDMNRHAHFQQFDNKGERQERYRL